MSTTHSAARPALLVIMDGFGLDAGGPSNAISLAHTPVLDSLFKSYPHCELEASGQSVGLPDGQMGNSEVGHLTIGSGRVIHQELSRITQACEHNELQDNEVLAQAFMKAVQEQSCLHFLGLLSDGGVHSFNGHLYALILSALSFGVQDIALHCFLDGRDVDPKSALTYLEELEAFLAQHELQTRVHIASVAGRYWAMDRDKRYDRIQKAYNACVLGQPQSAGSPKEYILASYEKDITDEFVEPCAFGSHVIEDNDVCIFFNFRPDRARELSYALTDPHFNGFKRERLVPVHFVCLTEYDPNICAPVAFKKEFPEHVLADVLSEKGLRQFHIAETEKYAHVTFFFNGGKETPKIGEERVLIASPKVATYDLLPAMSAEAVTDALIDAIHTHKADFYVVNYANCDMVGHTGKLDAAIQAVETVDSCLGRVLDELHRQNGFCLITADHGNADKMSTLDGTPFTAHTLAHVPLIYVDDSHSPLRFVLPDNRPAALCDIAPTILTRMGIEIPCEMTGCNLLQ